MTTLEPTYLIVNGVGQDGMFEHRLSGSLTALGIEPMKGHDLIKKKLCAFVLPTHEGFE